MNLLINFLPKKKNFINDNNLVVHRPYEINQIPSLFQECIKNDVKKYNIKGLTFFPEFSEKKLIYIFDKNDDSTKYKLYNNIYENNNLDNSNNNLDNSHNNLDNSNNKNIITNVNSQFNKNDNLNNKNIYKKIMKFSLFDIEIIDDIILNLEMHKTNIFDVFRLFGIFENNKKYIKKYIGIAHIPTYELSLHCKKIFEN